MNWRQRVKFLRTKTLKVPTKVRLLVLFPILWLYRFVAGYHSRDCIIELVVNLGRQIYLIIDNLIEELTFTIEELTPTYFDNEVVMGETRALI